MDSSIKSESFGGAKHWLLIIHNFSGYCWSHMLEMLSATNINYIRTVSPTTRYTCRRNLAIFVRLTDALHHHLWPSNTATILKL